LLPAARLLTLERSIRRVVRRNIPGDIVECGVAQGGSSALLALWLRRLNSDKKIYAFDTFEGLPAPNLNDPDYSRAEKWTGKCRGDLADVSSLFDSLGVLDRAVFVKGKFEDTLAGSNVSAISLLHMDADWYDSTLQILENLWDRVSPGGIVQIDDYGTWQGCRKAVDEFFAKRGIVVPLVMIDSDAGWLVKPATNGVDRSAGMARPV
jgi:hypothetical protein